MATKTTSERLPGLEITPEFIKRFTAEKQDWFRDDDRKLAIKRSLREQRDQVVLPKGKTYVDIIVRDNVIPEEIDRKSATFVVNTPKCRVSPIMEGDTSQDENATNREKWHESILDEAGKRAHGASLSTFEAVTDACVGDGGAWSKVIHNSHHWDKRYSLSPDHFEDDDEYITSAGSKGKSKYDKYDEATEEAKVEAGNPFWWIPVDALTVYPDWNGSKLRAMIEVCERPISAVLNEFGLKYIKGKFIPSEMLGPEQPASDSEGSYLDNDRDMPKMAKCYQYWTETQYWYLISGGTDEYLTDPIDHGYRRVPYFYMPGRMPNYLHGHKIANGVADTKTWLVAYKNYLMTVHAQVAAIQAYPILFRTRPADAQIPFGKDGAPMVETSYSLGTIVEGQPGETLAPLQWPVMAQTFKEQLAMVDKMIDKSSSPHVAPDIGKGVEGAGYAITTQIAEAKIVDFPYLRHIQDGLVEISLFIEHLVRNVIKETVWCYYDGKGKGWIGMGPEDLWPGVKITWSLDPERAQAKLIDARYLAERVKNGSLSLTQMIERLGDNPDEVRFLRALDEIRESEAFKKLRDERVFQRIGRGDLVADAVKMADSQGTPTSQPIGSGGVAGAPPPRGMAGTPMGGTMGGQEAQLAQSPGGAGVASRGLPSQPVRPRPVAPAASRRIPMKGVGTGPGAVMPMKRMLTNTARTMV